MGGIPRRNFRFKKFLHICLVSRPVMPAHAWTRSGHPAILETDHPRADFADSLAHRGAILAPSPRPVHRTMVWGAFPATDEVSAV